jgi:hypothetical protein
VGGALAGGETVGGTDTALVEDVVDRTTVVGIALAAEVVVVETTEVGPFVTVGADGERRGVVSLVVISVGGSKPWIALVAVVAVPIDALDAQPATMAMTMTAAPAVTQGRQCRRSLLE